MKRLLIIDMAARYLFFIIAFSVLFFSGCRAKRSTTYVEKVKDSTVRNIIIQSRNTLEVSTLCDSIGNAKEFFQVIETGSGTAKVEVKENRLTIDVRRDSIVYIDKWKERTVTDFKSVTVYKVPLWAWWYMVIVTALVAIGWKVWRLFF